MLEHEIAKKLKSINSLRISEISVPRARRIFVYVDKEHFKDVIAYLQNESFSHLTAITGLETSDAIELLYHLNKDGILLTVRVKLPLNLPIMPTITDTIPGASLYEREAHDFYGVKFEGHSDLKRLILPDEWPEGVHPLRTRQTIEDARKETSKKRAKLHEKG